MGHIQGHLLTYLVYYTKCYLVNLNINVTSNVFSTYASLEKCPMFLLLCLSFVCVFGCLLGSVRSNNCSQAYLSSLQCLPPGLVQDIQPCGQETLCSVCQRSCKHHSQPCQNYKGMCALCHGPLINGIIVLCTFSNTRLINVLCF